MCINNLPKVATQWNSGATRDSNRGRRVLIPSALTTTPPIHSRPFKVTHFRVIAQPIRYFVSLYSNVGLSFCCCCCYYYYYYYYCNYNYNTTTTTVCVGVLQSFVVQMCARNTDVSRLRHFCELLRQSSVAGDISKSVQQLTDRFNHLIADTADREVTAAAAAATTTIRCSVARVSRPYSWRTFAACLHNCSIVMFRIFRCL